MDGESLTALLSLSVGNGRDVAISQPEAAGVTRLNALRPVLNVFTQNERLNEFWRPLVGREVKGDDLAAETRAAVEEWRDAVDEILAVKLAAPFEQIPLSARFIIARDRCAALGPRIEN